jgi:imidazole glycerol-phosphate synthase subunit HisH
MIAIIDNDMGNIQSLYKALESIGSKCEITANHQVIQNADKLILPGVGNFAEASKRLQQNGLMKLISEEVLSHKKPILGICLGMQLLLEEGTEDGLSKGFGFIPGSIQAISNRLKHKPVPHMGWNDLKLDKESPLFHNIKSGDCAYFVHSYEAICKEEFISTKTNYDIDIVSSVELNNVYGVQFHPEKSQYIGLQILRNFTTLC